jgi:hypothetical protein
MAYLVESAFPFEIATVRAALVLFSNYVNLDDIISETE